MGGFPLRKYREIGRLVIKQTNMAFHESVLTAKKKEKNDTKIESPNIIVTITAKTPTLHTSKLH
jgi:hypothetical protein